MGTWNEIATHVTSIWSAHFKFNLWKSCYYYSVVAVQSKEPPHSPSWSQLFKQPNDWLHYLSNGSSKWWTRICRACKEHWQSVPKSGNWIDLYLPTLLSSFSTKACTSRCQATEVSSFPCCLPSLIFLSSRSLQSCDFALQSATDSGKEVTDNANKCFEEANQVLSGYSKRFYLK